ncbi:MAG: hypothetical protein ACM3UY_07955 [Methanocella sp.]|jgi:prepilin signal peptidase PulO-like enzyme (type II secretory pathway)
MFSFAEAVGLAKQLPPGWLKYAAVILLLPVGFIFITLLLLIFNVTGAGPHYPEEVLIVFSLVILIFFVARIYLWRRHLQQIWQT